MFFLDLPYGYINLWDTIKAKYILRKSETEAWAPNPPMIHPVRKKTIYVVANAGQSGKLSRLGGKSGKEEEEEESSLE